MSNHTEEIRARVEKEAEELVGFHLEGGDVVYDNGNYYHADPNHQALWDAMLIKLSELQALREENARLKGALLNRQRVIWGAVKGLRDQTADAADNTERLLKDMQEMGMDTHLPTIDDMSGLFGKSDEEVAAIRNAGNERAVEAALSSSPAQEPHGK